jgi:hypothetical protein
MTFAIDDAFLPATLSYHPMTDEEFASFCAEHPDLNFEMTAAALDLDFMLVPPADLLQ